MNQNYYKQCILSKPTPKGKLMEVAWIPVEFAKKGKILKLKQEDGEWTDGWIVEDVGSTLNPIEVIETVQKSAKDHRKTTDI